jgi:TatD DNase family protein
MTLDIAMPWIDTHAHLNHEQFAGDWQDALRRAKVAGVEVVVNIGYDLTSSERAVRQVGEALADGAKLVAAVAIHPHAAKEWNDEVAERLMKLAKQSGVVAIGEIGLDFHYHFSPPEAQYRAFAEQLELAWQLGLPVILHIREAYPEALEVVRRFGKPLRGVAHCFTGNWDDAQAWLAMGFHIGITGIVTFGRKAETVREVAAKVPLERLLLETDAPYLAPHPHRGKRNEPAHLPLVAECVAQLRGETSEWLMAATTQNAIRLFGL